MKYIFAENSTLSDAIESFNRSEFKDLPIDKKREKVKDLFDKYSKNLKVNQDRLLEVDSKVRSLDGVFFTPAMVDLAKAREDYTELKEELIDIKSSLNQLETEFEKFRLFGGLIAGSAKLNADFDKFRSDLNQALDYEKALTEFTDKIPQKIDQVEKTMEEVKKELEEMKLEKEKRKAEKEKAKKPDVIDDLMELFEKQRNNPLSEQELRNEIKFVISKSKEKKPSKSTIHIDPSELDKPVDIENLKKQIKRKPKSEKKEKEPKKKEKKTKERPTRSKSSVVSTSAVVPKSSEFSFITDAEKIGVLVKGINRDFDKLKIKVNGYNLEGLEKEIVCALIVLYQKHTLPVPIPFDSNIEDFNFDENTWNYKETSSIGWINYKRPIDQAISPNSLIKVLVEQFDHSEYYYDRKKYGFGKLHKMIYESLMQLYLKNILFCFDQPYTNRDGREIYKILIFFNPRLFNAMRINFKEFFNFTRESEIVNNIQYLEEAFDRKSDPKVQRAIMLKEAQDDD